MYGIPSHIVAVIKHFYADFSCSVGNSDLSFIIKSGVRQGCVMSGLLFNIVIDWVLCRTTEGRRRGIHWSLTSVLEDLDYADDIVLLSHSVMNVETLYDCNSFNLAFSLFYIRFVSYRLVIPTNGQMKGLFVQENHVISHCAIQKKNDFLLCLQ